MTELVRTECDACGYLTQCYRRVAVLENSETLHYCRFCYCSPIRDLRGPNSPVHLHINRNSNAILDALGGNSTMMFPKREPGERT